MTELYARSSTSILVGRQKELAELRQLLWSTKQSTAQNDNRRVCVLLEGEAGIGKTRLAEEISRVAESDAWTVLWSRAQMQEANVPYWLWIKLLRTIIQEGLWFPPLQEPERAVFAPLVLLLPELADFFPVESASIVGSQRQMLPLLVEALLAVLASITVDAPLLLVLDDIHWVDTTSCELLSILVHRITSFPLLVIGTYRETELVRQERTLPLSALIAALQRDHHDSLVHLPRLDDTSIESLVSAISSLPEAQVLHIKHQAEGNPFYAEELARSSTASSLSTTLTAALESRLRVLSTACRHVLSHASVVGGTFDLSVLLALEADSSEETLFDLLDEALGAKILVEQGNASHISYHFWHPLLVSHLYERLSKTRRAKLHRHVAGAIQHVYRRQEEEWAAAIVYHLIAGGGEQREILHYALIAADRAYSLSAYAEATHHYRIARDAVEEVQHQLGNLRLEQHEDLWRSVAALSERLAECCAACGEFAEARRLYEDVLYQWTKKSAEAPQHDRDQAHMVALLWCEIGWTWYDEGDLEHARSCCDQGVQVLQEYSVEGGSALARLCFCQASSAWRAGDYSTARDTGYEALRLFEKALQQPQGREHKRVRSTRISRTLEGDPIDLGRVHALLGPFMRVVGQTDKALAHLNTALSIFEEYECSREIAHVCCNRADAYMQKKDYTLAKADLERSRALAERIGDIPLQAAVIGNLGIIATDTGHFAEAERHLQQSVKLAQHIHDTLFESMWLVYLADAYIEQQKFVDARTTVCRALLLGRLMRNTPCIGHALVIVGTLRATQALALSNTASLSAPGDESPSPIRLLKRARSALQHAFTYALEEEFKVKGERVLIQATHLLEQGSV